jgi:phosphoribosylanthranilate isomerase
VQRVLATGLFDLLQFHGDETAEFCQSFGVPFMRAFRVQPGQNLSSLISQFGAADLILLDSYDEKAPGGTGKVFDWSQAEAVAESRACKLVLAGGLNPDNIGTAITQLNPFGVDVSSGVEQSPGIKDPVKMKLLIEGARSVEHRSK